MLKVLSYNFVFCIIFTFLILNEVDSCEKKDKVSNRVEIIQMLDTNFVFEFDDLKSYDTLNYLLYSAQIEKDEKLDTIYLVLKKNLKRSQIIPNKVMYIKLCPFVLCIKSFLNNQNFLDYNEQHDFIGKDGRIDFNDMSVIYKTCLNNKANCYYFAEEWDI